MKKVILIMCLLPYLVKGQISDNFEQGTLTLWQQSVNGHWKADTSESINGGFSLHHIYDNPEAGTDQAGIKTDSLHPSEGLTVWSFRLRHGYDPSSSNNWSVFLMSDTDPSIVYSDGGTNGYAIGVNLTGYDDTLRLWKVKGAALSAVVNTHLNWQSAIGNAKAAEITVARDNAGQWNVTVRDQDDELLCTATGGDNELFSCAWFVLSYKYSSSRDRLIWFDDLNITGVFRADNNIPVIKSCISTDPKTLTITLDSKPDENFAVPGNFRLFPSGETPLTATMVNKVTCILGFSHEFVKNESHTLSISEICNVNGQCIADYEFPFISSWPSSGDVAITEIMADPDPVVSLPASEYLEITNTQDHSVSLNGWFLSTGTQDYSLPDINLNPYEAVTICSQQDTALFSVFSRTIGLKPFPSLTDNGRLLLLYNNSRELINGVEYSREWYKDELRSQGGWSLEMIDTGYPFYGRGNWNSSLSAKGGTPGLANSVSATNSDQSFYGNLNFFPVDSGHISVSAAEPLFMLPDMKDSLLGDDISVSSVSVEDPLFRKFILLTAKPLKRNTLYHAALPGGITDFAGNRPSQSKYSFGLAEPAGQGDIRFNELLFNPYPGDPDYIEFCNVSDKVIDISRLELVSVSDASGDTSQIYIASDDQRCFLPGAFYVLTTDPEKVAERYFSACQENIFEVSSMPSMPDDKGHLILFSRELEKIDEVVYDDDMQSSLLSDNTGVALEKLNPDLSSQARANWHSATGASGWGTPGAPNSVVIENQDPVQEVILSSSRISPDDDGVEDLLMITFNLKGSGNIVSVRIFDEAGSYVRTVTANMPVGQGNTLIWDGKADDGSMVGTGIYIIFIESYSENGSTGRWKKVCTVLRR